MFESLSSRFEEVYKKIRGQARLTESNVNDIMRDIRRTLLDADVNYKVAKKFVDDVQAKALGSDVLHSVSPEQQFIKILYDELVLMMGETSKDITYAPQPPTIVMVCGLQGSGKTTFCAKLANMLQAKNRKPLLVAADIYRPAAIEQLQVLGKQAEVPVFSIEGEKNAVKIAEQGLKYARDHANEVVIVDTAGRLTIDEAMMQEVADIKSRISPNEILFVCDAMTGQDAVTTAKAFHDRLAYDGVVLTKLDGDARGGAALSIRSVVDEPIKFVSTGEKLDAIELFHPDRMASRILGMGDVVSLVERVEAQISEEEARKTEEKLRKAEFTFDDFLTQLGHIKKMGSMRDLLSMIPGVNSAMIGSEAFDDKAMTRVEAIVHSMTADERRFPHILNASRRARIALGSGTSVQQVNQLVKQFTEMQKIIKKMSRGGGMRKEMKDLMKGRVPG